MKLLNDSRLEVQSLLVILSNKMVRKLQFKFFVSTLCNTVKLIIFPILTTFTFQNLDFFPANDVTSLAPNFALLKDLFQKQ